MKVYIETYGCTFNQADSELIANALHNGGIETCSSEEEAEVVLMNTCTVKGATQNRITYKLMNLEKQGRKMLVTGCMAGANSDIIEKYAPSASIARIQNIAEMPSAVKAISNGHRSVYLEERKTDRISFYNAPGSVIAKIPLSDGCLSSCSFCETKFARGALNSFSEQGILNAISYSVRKGSKEIELTAQDTGAYGIDKGTNIAQLLKRACEIEGDFRIRVGMLNPEHMHRYMDELIEALQNPHAYKFMHLPLQSGSNKVLASMRRGYTVEEYLDIIKSLREHVKNITIETDIIVGFPGETDEDFEETINVISEFRPEVTNMSRFAARPHALASRMPRLSDQAIKERSMKLSRMVRSMQAYANRLLIGRSVDVLLTEENDASINGRDDSYRQIVIPKTGMHEKPAVGSRVRATIYNATSNALYGRIN
ncbi:MAG: tRNA (N(6)-L-threonylcarbamoyladenosine(37)-C(2))-methylthiotransferase [Candidatus Marsarchaeota archaeon]|nr:tRNA (N(6)-L-threonylcarbamoyladenosine(37)-C(2))-methylthiotransferase [Candidatus Marsarchaeota archaeon]